MANNSIEVLGHTFKTRTLVWSVLLGPFVLWAVWAAFGVRTFLAIAQWIGQKDGDAELMAHLGQTGDLFGGVNALFAAYAFAGVAVAAFIQHKTFVVIEEEQRQQAFEPLFFNLMELSRSLRPRKLVDRFSQSHDFEWISGEINRSIVLPMQRGDLKSSDVSRELNAVSNEYIYRLYQPNEGELGPYFRVLYQTFKLIDKSGLGAQKR